MKPGTPLPWSVIDGQVFKVKNKGCDRIVAVFGEPMEEMVSQDCTNAAYAVHAANLYPELVAALRGCRECLLDRCADDCDAAIVLSKCGEE